MSLGRWWCVFLGRWWLKVGMDGASNTLFGADNTRNTGTNQSNYSEHQT